MTRSADNGAAGEAERATTGTAQHPAPPTTVPADRSAPHVPIASWLLTMPQLRHGPHAGAIAGVLDAAAGTSYVYPEIAGYYLRWLAFRALRFGGGGELAACAAATQRWLVHWSALEGPPTRVHLDDTGEDWRNGALFCFDLAMVLRGVGSAAAAGLLAPDAALLRALDAGLARCIASDGAFDAIVPLVDAAHLPARWSTRRGAFLAKAAAGVLRAATQLAVSTRVVAAAERTFESSIAALAEAPHPEAHPLLYACEGILDLPRHLRFREALPIMTARHAELLPLVAPDGYLPESTATPATGPSRIDVVAQALRVAHLLGMHGVAAPDAAALARLRRALIRHVEGDGGVRFSRESPRTQRNAWAAMFADQALAYPALVRATSPWWLDDPLLV